MNDELIARATHALERKAPFVYTSDDQEAYALPPLVRDLRDAIVERDKAIRRQREALECAEYALANPGSDQMFALAAVQTALREGE